MTAEITLTYSEAEVSASGSVQDPTLVVEVVRVVGRETAEGGSVTSVAGRIGAVTLTSADLTDATAAGRALLDDANAATQRATLGLGSAATQASSAFEPAGAVSTHAAVTAGAHGISAFGASLVDDADATAARSTLGLGGAAVLNVGTTAGTVAAGNDSRLSDARTPTAHTQGSETINTTQTDDATTSRTLTDADHGKVLRFTSGSAIGVTVPNTLRSDFTCTVIQFGAGQITFTGSSASIRNRQGHAKTAAQYAAASLVKVASGEFVLAGDTAT